MICHKQLTFKGLFAFVLCFKRARIMLASVMMVWLGGQNSFAGTNQIDIANKLVTKMMVEVETILATDINDDMARRENVSALFDRYFDLPTIAKFSAGPYWRTADADQKIAYKSAIRDVIIGTVVRNFDQLSGLKFTATQSQAKGTQLVLVLFRVRIGARVGVVQYARPARWGLSHLGRGTRPATATAGL